MEETLRMSDQPIKGDTVVHCEHYPALKRVLVVQSPIPLRFIRPDGTRGETKWIVSCPNCFVAAKGDYFKIIIHGERQWTGEEIVYEKEN